MNWQTLRVANCGTHHIDQLDRPAYQQLFDEVLKFHAPGLAPVRRNDSAWHVWSDGEAAYTRRFLRTFGFYDDRATVVGAGGWHHITTDGEDAYKARYTWCGNFQQGRCTVRSHDNNYHHIALDGEAVYSRHWRYAGDYRDGTAVVQAANGRSTHIRLDGSFMHGVWYTDLDVFHKGFARARDEDGWMHIDEKGQPAYRRRFLSVEPFYNGQARVERFDGALEVIDENGTSVVELRPALRSEFASLSGDMVGFWRTQTIAAAVSLGVLEALPTSFLDIAKRCQLNPDRTRRLLRALAELRLVESCGDKWNLTSRGEYLKEDHPLTLADAAIEYAEPFSKLWQELPHALKANSGWKARDVFTAVARNPERRVTHHRMLQSYARHDYTNICSVLDLACHEHVIDAGGGPGVLGQLIVSSYPTTQVTILDLPEVVAMKNISDRRLQWHGGNLLDPWGLRGDAVVMSRVLHDWDDDDAVQILGHARAALAPGGLLYIVEMLIAEDSVAGALCDLHLLMVTGGRERSADHFGRLLNVAGFKLSEVRKPIALPSVIVAVAV